MQPDASAPRLIPISRPALARSFETISVCRSGGLAAVRGFIRRPLRAGRTILRKREDRLIAGVLEIPLRFGIGLFAGVV